MKRTTIRMDEELFAKTKLFAARTGKTFQAVVEDALRMMLFRRPLPSTPSVVPPWGPSLPPWDVGREHDSFRLVTFKGDGLQPGVDLDDNASLLDLMEEDADPAV
jgi:hypothetical protein